jgi:cobalt-zinc-cadmium efflux system outer membrane protein
VRPALEDVVALAERAYQAGETSLVQVLDASRQLLDARVREAQAATDLRRARAELERSVGRRLGGDAGAAAATEPTEDIQ